ncbi:MAG: hypothetical protein COV44_08040 [Deltaproteobacteria bacterium CG11_big_fil_rev_8_21_14_0_20_45_16]|nr:MAG: hypothetical protein COV44_08040 [Deltaproteobacteria bacterium CG11_big_fil_rev_8_21_14_0_20_45_16]
MAKRVLIISGSSTGIGLEAAKDFCHKNYRVWAGVRSQSDFDQLALIPDIEPLILDITKAEHLRALEARLQDQSSQISSLNLINNAGIVYSSPWELQDIEELKHQFEVNFFGAIRLTQICLPLIRKTRGRIIDISSISGRFASPFLGPYASSKFALDAFSDSLRRELRPTGVKVVSINPGPIRTPLWQKRLGKMMDWEKIESFSPDLKTAYYSGLSRFYKRIEDSAKKAEPVEIVLRALHKALLSKNPPPRIYVGRGVASFSRLQHWIPERLLDSLVEKLI